MKEIKTEPIFGAFSYIKHLFLDLNFIETTVWSPILFKSLKLVKELNNSSNCELVFQFSNLFDITAQEMSIVFKTKQSADKLWL